MTFNPIRTRNAIGNLVPEQESPTLTFGTVTAINADGSVQVLVGAQSTRCTPLSTMAVNDRVGVAFSSGTAFSWRIGGELPHDVLYYDASGTAGTVTLSGSAADYDFMRVFFLDNNDYYGSVDVHKPNGKSISTQAIYPDGSTSFWINGTVWSISGTSITNVRHGNADIVSHSAGTADNIKIYRVEAW